MASEPDPIADALDNPMLAPQLAEPGDRIGESGGESDFERPPFPPGSPVRPLGIASDITGSQKCFYLDVNGQLVGLEAGNKHGKNSMLALYGIRSDWLEYNFPQHSAPKFEGRGKDRVLVKDCEIIGFDQAEASRALIEECARKGVFDPAGRLRGRGAHPLPNGGLVVHYGDQLYASKQRKDGSIYDWEWFDTDLHGGYVYSRGAPIPRPHHESCGPHLATQLLLQIGTWNWKRDRLDAYLFLGAIGASMIGGALKWRPNVWITGGAGTGKSSLNGEGGLTDGLLGAGVLRTGNASAAAIRQTLKNSTVPVMFDEIEASEDNRSVTQVVELARVASSGATMHRGGQDHQAHEFTLRSLFWFSSINIPPLQPQDRSRLAILELRPLPADAPALRLDKLNLPAMGKALQRRMIDGWPLLEETIARFHEVLARKGHSRRAADQFGTLLACAHRLLNDDLPDDEELAEWADLCAPNRMAEVSEATADHEACLAHILTTLQQARGGEEREAIGTWVGRSVASKVDPLFEGEGGITGKDRSDERLQQLGLKVVNANWKPEERSLSGEVVKPGRWGATQFISHEPGFLAVANSYQGMAAIFNGTKWQGGVWKQSLARSEGAIEGVKVKFAFGASTSVLVPLWLVLGDDAPDASKPDKLAEWVAAQVKGSGL